MGNAKLTPEARIAVLETKCDAAVKCLDKQEIAIGEVRDKLSDIRTTSAWWFGAMAVIFFIGQTVVVKVILAAMPSP